MAPSRTLPQPVHPGPGAADPGRPPRRARADPRPGQPGRDVRRAAAGRCSSSTPRAGIGKTSLLRAAQRETAALGFVSVWVSCVRGTPVLPELVAGVARSLERADVVPRGGPSARWRTRLDRIGVELGVPGLKVSADVRSGPDGRHRPRPRSRPSRTCCTSRRGWCATAAAPGCWCWSTSCTRAAGRSCRCSSTRCRTSTGPGRRTPSPSSPPGCRSPRRRSPGRRPSGSAARSSPSTCSPMPTPGRPSPGRPTSSASPGPDRPSTRWWPSRAATPTSSSCSAAPSWAAAAPAAGDRIGMAAVRAGIPAATGQVTAMYRARWGSATPTEQAFLDRDGGRR